LFVAAASLALLVLCGVATARLGLIRDPEQASDVLNRLVVNLAFPAWVVALLASGPALRALWPAVTSVTAWMVLWVPIAWMVSRLLQGAERRAVAFCCLIYGNSAYIGIPFATSTFGAAAGPDAVAIATVHLVLGMTLMPWVLTAARAEGGSPGLLGVLRQPLFVAPWIGMLVRLMPEWPRELVAGVLMPLGKAASPMALLALGLHLWHHRAQAAREGSAASAIGLGRMIGSGLVAFAVTRWPGGSAVTDHVLLSQSTVPVGIAVFALAQRHGVGESFAARAIVVSTIAWLLGALGVAIGLQPG
jgi:predicted permease